MSSIRGPVLTSAPTSSFASSPDAFGLRRSASAGSPTSTSFANSTDAASALAASLASLGLNAKFSIPVAPPSYAAHWVPPATGANAIAVGSLKQLAAQDTSTGQCDNTTLNDMHPSSFLNQTISLDQSAGDMTVTHSISQQPFSFLPAASPVFAQAFAPAPVPASEPVSAFETWYNRNANNNTSGSSSAFSTSGSAFPPARASAFPPAGAGDARPNTNFAANASAFGAGESSSSAFAPATHALPAAPHAYPTVASAVGLRSIPSVALQNVNWMGPQSTKWMTPQNVDRTAFEDDAMDTSPDDPDAMDTSDDGAVVPGFDFLAQWHPLRELYNPDALQALAPTHHSPPLACHQPTLDCYPFVPHAPPAPPQPTNSNAYDALRLLDDSVAALHPSPPRDEISHTPVRESLFGCMHSAQRSSSPEPMPEPPSSLVDELMRRHSPSPVARKIKPVLNPFLCGVRKRGRVVDVQAARARKVYTREVQRREMESVRAPGGRPIHAKSQRRPVPPCMVPAKTWKALEYLKKQEMERAEMERVAAAIKDEEEKEKNDEKTSETRQCDLTKLSSRLLSAACEVPWVWMSWWQ